MPALRLAEIVELLERRYPLRTAEPWDAVGLAAGDPQAPVARVVLAIDPVEDTVDEALDWGADLLISHHPLLLRGVHSVAATSAKGRLVHRLIRGGCALYTAHTNADGARRGVAHALAAALGLVRTRPVVPHAEAGLDALVTYVPVGGAQRLVAALSAAGAGAIGEYEQCAWVTDGLGQFLPGPGAQPAVGEVGRLTRVEESRIEMVLPRGRRAEVVRALRAAHPYEEPAFSVAELAGTEAGTGLGRVGDLAEQLSLGELAQRVADALPATAHGVRVSGALDARVQRVAVCGGSGDSLLDQVRRLGADVYVTADLRHHRASEARQDGDGGRPFLVDVAHWASEWPWLPLAAADLRADVEAAGATVETRVSTVVTDPWTARLDPAPDRLAGPPRRSPGVDL